MKIVLMSSASSGIKECLTSVMEAGETTFIDFSGNNVMSVFCNGHHLRYIIFVSWEQLERELRGYDLLISYKLNKIIPLTLVHRFKFGGINIHPSILPKYAGINPWFRIYYDMELESGVTIHKINEKPDSGNIIVQQTFRIEPGQPLSAAMKTADNIVAQLIVQVITNRLFLNSGHPQYHEEECSVSHIELSSLKQLPAIRLWHVLRGFHSLISTLYPELPHVFFKAGEYRLQICNKSKIGSVETGNSGLNIICTDGKIELLDISLAPTVNM